MEFNADMNCYCARTSGPGSFQICPGRAQGKRWKGRNAKWTIPNNGKTKLFNVRLFLRDNGGVQKVDWVKADA